MLRSHAASPALRSVTRQLLAPALVLTLSLTLAGCGAKADAPRSQTATAPASTAATATSTATAAPTAAALDVNAIYANLAKEIINNPEQLYTYYADYYQRSTGREYHLDGTRPDGPGYSYPSVGGTFGAGSWRFWRTTPQEQWGQVMQYYLVEPGPAEQTILVITLPEDIPDNKDYGAGGGYPHQVWFAVDRQTQKPYMLRVSVHAPTIIDGHVVCEEMVGSAGDHEQLEEYIYDEAKGTYTSKLEKKDVDLYSPQSRQSLKWTLTTGKEVSYAEVKNLPTPPTKPLDDLAK